MAIIGHGYGSEWHLIRWMGRHRRQFDRRILTAMHRDSSSLKWEDLRFRKGDWPDEELQGLEFLQDEKIQAAWRSFWPATGRAQTWDAVGWITSDEAKELVLVEAKAHLGEIASNCNASERGGKSQIERAFAEVKQSLSIPKERDWCLGYYQYANRLAALHFLQSHGIPAHLLFIYFTGDISDSGRNCPKDEEGWKVVLQLQNETLGLPDVHPLSLRIHKLFLPVAGS